MRKSAYLQITRNCNNFCVFCSNPQFEKDYSLEEAKQRVLEFKNEGITDIWLTGGEPTIVDFLPELIKFIKEQGIYPRIITNGVELSNKMFVKKIYDLGVGGVNVSIHSYNEEIADKLSQKKGHFKKTLLGVRNALDLGIDVQINSTINSLNCKHLSEQISFFIKKFPEVNHYVFNNLDPGSADGNMKSRAGENPWIVPKFIDFELELNKTIKILKENNKTFRIERIPLCYLDGIEEFSTETRMIIKDESYICSFVLKDSHNIIRDRKPQSLYEKADCCKICKLNSICVGVQSGYVKLYGKSELYPVFKEPKEIIKKVKKETFDKIKQKLSIYKRLNKIGSDNINLNHLKNGIQD